MIFRISNSQFLLWLTPTVVQLKLKCGRPWHSSDGQSPTAQPAFPGAVQKQSIWNSWWTKRQERQVLLWAQEVGSFLSTIINEGPTFVYYSDHGRTMGPLEATLPQSQSTARKPGQRSRYSHYATVLTVFDSSEARRLTPLQNIQTGYGVPGFSLGDTVAGTCSCPLPSSYCSGSEGFMI
jgi:hypothetical protein